MTTSAMAPASLALTAHGEAPRWRELYLLAGMRAASFAGDIAAATAVTLYLQANSYPTAFIVATLVASAAPGVLLAPLTGRMSDRFDSRKILVAVALSQVVLCLVMAAWLNPYAVVALTALISAGLAFSHPIFGGLPRSMVGIDNVTRASSISQTSAMAGMLVAPALGAFLAGSFGTQWALVFNAITFAFVAVGAMLITTRLHAGRGAASAGGAENANYSVWRDRLIRTVLLATGVVVTCVSINNVLGVYLVRDTLGGTAQQYGMIGSAWMVGLVIGSMAVGRNKRMSSRAQVLLAYIFMGVALLLAAFVSSVWLLIPAWLIGGIGNGTMATNLHVILNLEVPDAHRGRAFAALGAVSNAAPMTGYLVGGFLLAAAGPQTSYLVIGTLACLCACVVAPAMLRRSEQQTDDSLDDAHDRSLDEDLDGAPVGAPDGALDGALDEVALVTSP